MNELLSHLTDENNGGREKSNSVAKAAHGTSRDIGLAKLQRVNL